PVDARVIASTNREPTEAVRVGQLRSDLYYRLQASVLRIPPLRERLDDVPLLIEHFINVFNERLKRPVPITGIAENAMAAMQSCQWPGNVRELSNAIEGAFTFGRTSSITLADLPPQVAGPHRETGVLAIASPVPGTEPGSDGVQ